MRRYLFLGCFLFVSGLIFAQTAPTKDQVSQAATLLGVSESDLQKWVDSKFVSIPTGVPEITAVQLYQEYEASQPRADLTYKGKQIKVTGIVSTIQEEYDSNYNKRYCLKFQTSSYVDLIHVFFDDSDIEQIFNVGKGQNVSVLGTLVEKSGMRIRIDHAKIIQ